MKNPPLKQSKEKQNRKALKKVSSPLTPKIRYRARSKTVLKKIADETGTTENDRILLFYPYGDFFYSPTMYSRNLKFQTNEVTKVPNTDLLFIKALTKGISCEKDCPVYEESPKAYFSFLHSTYKMPLSAIAKLSMKSCRFLSLAIMNEERVAGIITFESINPHFIIDCEQIELIVRKCKDYEPELLKLLHAGAQEETVLQNIMRVLP